MPRQAHGPPRTPWDVPALRAALAAGGKWDDITRLYNAATGQRRGLQSLFAHAARKRLRRPAPHRPPPPAPRPPRPPRARRAPPRTPWDQPALLAAIAAAGTWEAITRRYNAATGQRRPMHTVYSRARTCDCRKPPVPNGTGRPRLTPAPKKDMHACHESTDRT
jgi:hypothetical protein